MITEEQITAYLGAIEREWANNQSVEVYKFCLSALDMTTLSPCDTEASVKAFAERVMQLSAAFPELTNVASICVYPPFVESVGLVVDGSSMRITGVAGGFPSSQTFLEVKALEVAMAIESGADEIDTVIPVGLILEGRYDEATSDIRLLREECGSDVTLKVILESGELRTPELIYAASQAAMEGGADFIKTSTGKVAISATPESAIVMAQAIRDFYNKSGVRVGLKIAGGVRTAADAALYYTIVEHILGSEWLTPQLFRIGASSLGNELLSAIVGKPVTHF
ncbi:MAG: deoxyribose-phosphate aldolase [Rikenellaceae bacterium]